MTTIDPYEYQTSRQNGDASKIDSTELTTAESIATTVASNNDHDAISAAEKTSRSPTDFTPVLTNVSSYNVVSSGAGSSGEDELSTQENSVFQTSESLGEILTATDSATTAVTRPTAGTEYSVAATNRDALGMENTTAIEENFTQPFTDTKAITGMTTNPITVTSTPVKSTDGIPSLTTNVSPTSRSLVSAETTTAEITTQAATETSHTTSASVATEYAQTTVQVTQTDTMDNPTTTLVISPSESTKHTTVDWTTQRSVEEHTTSGLVQLSTSDISETTNAQTSAANQILGLKPEQFYAGVAGVGAFILLLVIIAVVWIIMRRRKRQAALKAKENNGTWISRSNAAVALSNITSRPSNDYGDPEQPDSSRLSRLVNAPTVNIFANQEDGVKQERSPTAVTRTKSSASPKSTHDKTPEKKTKGLTVVSIPIVTPKMDETIDEPSGVGPTSPSSFHSTDSDDDKRQTSFLYKPLFEGSSVPSITESNLDESVGPTTTEHTSDGDTADSNNDTSQSAVVSPVRPAPPPPVSSAIPVAPPPPPAP